MAASTSSASTPAESSLPPSVTRPQPPSFARRDGRLSRRRQRAWDQHGERFVLEVPRARATTSVAPHHAFDQAAEYGRLAPLVAEIGSGGGEVVAHAAAEHPQCDFLAVEVYRPGIAQTLSRLAAQELDNVRLVLANAVDVVRTMLPAGSVSEVWTFFPDPWPKARHHKRRLVDDEFASLVARVLRPGGVWRLATDWADYADQMCEVASRSPDFANRYAGLAPRFAGRPMTRFEVKGLAAGRAVHDLELTRR
ncbi:MAG TPA: tRNA (guanosine(46)-N7)-methyltransferase TrmB [Segeticoccus sp.]|uniref:tRNA (guanosine(46)-N7)-methyltransferase TrmB n=1 Tax=Segeticoccus sp. TaxID=2706531 RepID=UPI002D7F0698|nr:tRNA (guanosine(46)-N7)-methyltransferase TrmB [Segeticoccus sp.]HET8599576.1 tRNA (guanosine(46)-N7)-methyltransferase TrmB [Segeticoccus sp.]